MGIHTDTRDAYTRPHDLRDRLPPRWPVDGAVVHLRPCPLLPYRAAILSSHDIVDAVEDGEGLTEEAAEVASIAIESIRNRLGFRAQSRLVPATESFGNTNTRVMSTRLVIEGIGDTIKKIWAAIKAAALRVWEMIKSFFAKLFNSATMLAKHIQALKDRARGMSGDLSPKDKKIKTQI